MQRWKSITELKLEESHSHLGMEGEKKSHIFLSALPWSFGNSENSMPLRWQDLLAHITDCTWDLPRSIRGGISAYLALQPMENAAPGTGVFIWWHRRGERPFSPKCSDLKRRALCIHRTIFSISLPWTALGMDSLCCERTEQCDTDWPWGRSFDSSILPQPQWCCLLEGSSCPLSGPLGSPYFNSRRHLSNFNLIEHSGPKCKTWCFAVVLFFIFNSAVHKLGE